MGESLGGPMTGKISNDWNMKIDGKDLMEQVLEEAWNMVICSFVRFFCESS
jgi:hypothetical protein